jgi:hypothetical protein
VAKSKSVVPVVFTPEELKVIGSVANRVWSEIAHDCLSSEGDGAGLGTLKRDEVIELVMDANRLEDALKREVKRAGLDETFMKRVEEDIYSKESQIERHLSKDVFKHSRYGL